MVQDKEFAKNETTENPSHPSLPALSCPKLRVGLWKERVASGAKENEVLSFIFFLEYWIKKRVFADNLRLSPNRSKLDILLAKISNKDPNLCKFGSASQMCFESSTGVSNQMAREYWLPCAEKLDTCCSGWSQSVTESSRLRNFWPFCVNDVKSMKWPTRRAKNTVSSQKTKLTWNIRGEAWHSRPKDKTKRQDR